MYNTKDIVKTLSPSIRRSRSTILLKFRIKTLVKNLKTLCKLRNLSLSLRIGPRWGLVGWLVGWLRGLDWLKLSSSCVRTEQEELGKELWRCVLDIGWFWRTRRALRLSRIWYFMFSSHRQGHVHCHLCRTTVNVTIQEKRLQFVKSVSLNCNFAVTPHLLYFL